MTQDSISRLMALAVATTAVFMTGQEAQELHAAGYIMPNASEPGPVPGSCRVTITQAGMQVVQSMQQTQWSQAATQPTVAVEKAKPVISEVSFLGSIPEAGKRGGNNNLKPRESIYPFDQLPEPAVGPDGQLQYASFHVAVTADNAEPWKSMASNVSAANKRFQKDVLDVNGQPVVETVTKRTLVKGADKKPLLDANGKKQYTETQETQAKKEQVKRFIARRVSKNDPNGEGVRVFRVPLDFAS